MRTILALAIAPLSFGTLILVVSAFLGDTSGGWWVFKLTCLAAYLVAFVGGIPAHLSLKYFGLRRLRHYALVGVLLSLFPVAYFVFSPSRLTTGEIDFYASDVIMTLLIILAGLVTSAAFWSIARPDR